MQESGLRSRLGSSGNVVGDGDEHLREHPVDDWLGDVGEDDWSENAVERAQRRSVTPYQGLAAPADDDWVEPTGGWPVPARPVDAAEAHRAVVERRRLVAGFVLVVVLGLAILIPVLLLRGGGGEATPSLPTEPATTSPAPSSSTPSSPSTPTTSSTPTTPTTTPTTTPSTTPSTPADGASSFTLPEGTLLKVGQGDPAVISQLQQALTAGGYDPGPVDGAFGPLTEAAVIAFQQANGLSADGVVGPETAGALNDALAAGAASG